MRAAVGRVFTRYGGAWAAKGNTHRLKGRASARHEQCSGNNQDSHFSMPPIANGAINAAPESRPLARRADAPAVG
jgi:hypothetical protein